MNPFKFKKLAAFTAGFAFCFGAFAQSFTYVTVEEARIKKASKEMPATFEAVEQLSSKWLKLLEKAATPKAITALTLKSGKELWLAAKADMQTNNHFDDRAFYWARLSLIKAIRVNQAFRSMPSSEQAKLIWQFELVSRGNDDIGFDSKADKKIFVTGFDPFLLDRNIKQSNPSGVAALWLDGKTLEVNGETVSIESVVVPVRFADFDMGMIEEILTPMFAEEKVDMVTTISMGRDHFDLERFPGLRRSVTVPDNLNVYTGASPQNPLKPFLNDAELVGPEFVEYSLPAEVMSKVKGPYQVKDNREITTLEKGKFSAASLAELAQQTAVQGGGGGYLSNEISYRSILLRDKYKPNTPVGHIHTPRYVDWDQDNVKSITLQIKGMLEAAAKQLD